MTPQDLKDQLISKLGSEVFKALEANLFFGSIFKIPDTISGIPSKRRSRGKTDDHPFIIVKYNRDSNQLVICAVRTSNLNKRGLFTPGGIVTGLEKPGIIVHSEPFKIAVHELIGLSPIGVLPEPFLSELKARLIAERCI